MGKIDRLFTTIVTDDVVKTTDFYLSFLPLKRHFDSDWFVILVPIDGPLLELAIMDRANDIVPETMKSGQSNGMLTFVVEDVEIVFGQAKLMGVDIVEPPTAMFYGQMRMLVRDPNGMILDISSPTTPVLMD